MSLNLENSSEIKALSAHLDWLDVNIYGAFRKRYRRILTDLATRERERLFGERGRKKEGKTTIEIRGHVFEVRPYSRCEMFTMSLESEEFDLHVSFGESEKTPRVKVIIRCLELIRYGSGDNWVEAYVRARHVIRELFEASRLWKEQPSRVDLACDVLGLRMKNADMDGLVTRAVNTKSYHPDRVDGSDLKDTDRLRGKTEGVEIPIEHLEWFRRRSKFTGLVAGSGPAMTRVYDKIAELFSKSPEKIDAMMELWGAERVLDAEGRTSWFYDGINLKDEPVWRVEFQLRRDKLRALKINTMQDLVERTGSLWDYMTDWFSLRVENPEQQQRTRWKLDDRWSVVKASIVYFSGTKTLELEKEVYVPPREKAIRLKQQMTGCMSSYGALLGFDNAGDLLEHLGKEQASWIPQLIKGIASKQPLNAEAYA